MGLISKAIPFKEITKKYLLPYLWKIGFLSFLVGIFLFAQAPNLAKKTYVSENALLVGSSKGSVSNQDVESLIKLYHNLFRSENIFDEFYTLLSQRDDIELFKQDLKVQAANGDDINSSKNKLFQNIVSISYSSRTQCNEAILIVAGIPDSNNLESNEMIYCLKLLDLLKRNNWMTKNAIFLFYPKSYGSDAINQFLNEYHQYNSKSQVLTNFTRAGAIHSGFVLDFNSIVPDLFYIIPEGLTGEVPNLDVINLMVREIGSACGRVLLHQQTNALINLKNQNMENENKSNNRYGKITLKEKISDLFPQDHKALIYMMLNLAYNDDPKGHEFMQRYKIDSATLQFYSKSETDQNNQYNSKSNINRNNDNNSGRDDNIQAVFSGGDKSRASCILKSLENIIRDLMKASEHFHQSFTYYLLPASRKFITNGDYLLGFLFWILWPTIGPFINELIFSVFPMIIQTKILISIGSLSLVGFGLLLASQMISIQIWLITFIITFCCCSLSLWMFQNSIYSSFNPSPILLSLILKKKSPSFDCIWLYQKTMFLIILVLSLVYLAILNISLSLILYIFTVPLFILIVKYENQFLNSLQIIAVILFSPFSIASIIAYFEKTSLISIIERGILSYLKYGNHIFPFCCLVWFPISVGTLVSLFRFLFINNKQSINLNGNDKNTDTRNQNKIKERKNK
ncbi:glycosylphosphatidylinositol anchor attachment 1 protein [Anaeramoeba flamelloides]|uniref:Glycosylphosphatidylinositol anchor attachment 1 protein n=1 Tax=Anaeramoeba flamelloides TaxID=1746091 RepID=A0AAV7ZRS0_9EUKA|nr:glycosylphosphatidylinositol anchor attachment 1 protein [Anaeramoeba flamelloides]